MKNTVFISYSSTDKDIARRIREELRPVASVWMAPESIPIGQSYAQSITVGIESCNTFLLVVSKNSCSSQWVEKELDNAIRLHKHVIPYKIDECELTKGFLFYLNNCQMILTEGRWEQNLPKLKAIIAGNPIETVDSSESYFNWLEQYMKTSLTKFASYNTVFTLLNLDYYGKKGGDLELDSLMLQYKKVKLNKLDAKSLVSYDCRFIVYGEAGSGKSTFLQKLFYDCCLEDSNSILPVFLKLSAYQPGKLLDMSMIFNALRESCDQQLIFSEFLEIIEHRKLICFFDAFDEYSINDEDERELLWQEIENFAKKKKCSLVITTRTEYLPKKYSFDAVRILPFNVNQQIEFITKYFDFFELSSNPSEFYQKLPDAIKQISTTPLILSMIVAAYISTGRVIPDANNLYNVIIRKFLTSKTILDIDSFSSDQRFLIASGVAFEMLLTGKTFLIFNAFMEVLNELCERYELTLDPYWVYRELIHSGLMSVNYDRLSFFHASVMTYLANCEINREYNFEAKINMDQYFLKNYDKIKKIINCINARPDDIIMEVGAGIGTVALSLPHWKKLYLVDLDVSLCKILSYNFRKKKDVIIYQKDAIEMLEKTDARKIISNLPFFLTIDVLNVLIKKDFDIAVMSVRNDDNLDYYTQYFFITEIDVITENDFFPPQPFKSKIIKIVRKR